MSDQRGGNVIDLTNKPTALSDASSNIVKVIEAAADAKTAQTELQKQVMLSKIDQQMKLQSNKEQLAQGVQSNIDQKNANVNWLEGLSAPAGASSGGGLNPNSGVADSGTAAATGGQPALPGQPPAAMPPAPAAQPAPSPTPMLNAAAQPKPNPALNGVVPQVPQGVSIPSPIGKPLPPPQGKIIIGKDGKPMLNPNFSSPDNQTYSAIYNKWKSGQPLSSGESQLIQNKFSNGPDGKLLAKNNTPTPPAGITPSTNIEVQPTTEMSKIQAGLRQLESQQGLPAGALWMNPSTGDAELSPIAKSKIEAQQRYDVQAPDRYGRMAEQDLMHIFSMRSGALGVQDAKINQAMHIKQLFDQSYDPKTGIYNLKAPQFAEATQGLATLVSNNNQTSEASRQEIKQRTLKGDFNGAVTYALGIPQNATSQEIAKMYIDAVDRQGLTAQSIKEKDISDIKNLDSFSQLKKFDPERAENLYKANFGVDYRDYIKKPWADRIKQVTGQSPDDQGATTAAQPTIFNSKTGKTMTLSADGKSWQ